MSLLDQLESALSRLAEGSAEAVFGGRLDLVATGQELLNAVMRETRSGERGDEAPNAFTILLSLSDYGELEREVERLQGQYARTMWTRLRDADCALAAPPRVLVTTSEAVAEGSFRLEVAFSDDRPLCSMTRLTPPGTTQTLGVPVTIGRDLSCDLCLQSLTVSRRHAQIVWARNHFQLVDLGSRNGTRLNDVPILRGLIDPGDVIGIGDVRLRFGL